MRPSDNLLNFHFAELYGCDVNRQSRRRWLFRGAARGICLCPRTRNSAKPRFHQPDDSRDMDECAKNQKTMSTGGLGDGVLRCILRVRLLLHTGTPVEKGTHAATRCGLSNG